VDANVNAKVDANLNSNLDGEAGPGSFDGWKR